MKYFLEFMGMKKEVTKDEFRQAERQAGFRCKCSTRCEHLATGGFHASGIIGTIIYNNGDKDEANK